MNATCAMGGAISRPLGQNIVLGFADCSKIRMQFCTDELSRAAPQKRPRIGRGPTCSHIAQPDRGMVPSSRKSTLSSEVIDATLLQATVERPARRERYARANSFHRRAGQD